MYIGVDLGTSSLKVLVSDVDGKILDYERKEYPIYYPKKDYSEQVPEDWYNALITTLKKLGERNSLDNVRAISFCGQMHGLVILDSNDNVLRPAILWNDNRTSEETRYLNETIGKEKLLEWTGNIAFNGFTAPKLLWLKKNEKKTFDKIAKIMLPKDYLVYKMSDIHASDVSDNSGTLYFDVKNKIWSKDMLSVIGIDEGQLPKIYESFEVVGTVSKKFSTLTGLSTNTKVVAGGGDQAVGAIGTGTIDGEGISVSLGTSGVVFASTDEYKNVGEGIHSFCHSNGKYHLMGCMLSCAGSLEFWLNNILNTTEFDKDVEAIKGASAGGLFFLPYLAGERSPINDPNAKGTFFGLTLGHTREDMTRAVVEGVSLGLKDCYLHMGINAKYARVIGGGVKSPEWLQILADCLGIEIRTLKTNEGGGLGAIILAMVADWAYKDIEQATKKLITYKNHYTPNPSKTKFYNDKYTKFKQLYSLLQKTK
ncbi:MAG: xylulokinase [Firmicutes bacterium]|nr:xylulokinase [Bacillota bacterium]